MYVVGVTLRSLKYLRYAILYIHHSSPFAMRTTKAEAIEKMVLHTQHKYSDSPPRPNSVNAMAI